jgi:Uma2 family endonuclease
MALDTRIMTAEELWRMPSDDLRHELVNGELKTMAPARFEHGAVGIKIAARILSAVEASELGVVVGADTGFVLRRNPDTVRAPDIAFVKAERIAGGRRTAKFFEGAPDLAVEIVSPGDTVDELEEKIADYLSAGCQMVWVVHPKTKSITIHRPTVQPVVLHEMDQLDGHQLLPGFRCAVAEIFA